MLRTNVLCNPFEHWAWLWARKSYLPRYSSFFQTLRSTLKATLHCTLGHRCTWTTSFILPMWKTDVLEQHSIWHWVMIQIGPKLVDSHRDMTPFMMFMFSCRLFGHFYLSNSFTSSFASAVYLFILFSFFPLQHLSNVLNLSMNKYKLPSTSLKALTRNSNPPMICSSRTSEASKCL